jgi:hypothetical protein
MIGRRGFITGLVSLVAAPAIVRVASIMPVKVMPGLTSQEIINRALLHMAERQVNPPLLDMGDGIWELNYDYAMNQIVRILHTPEKYLRVQ